MQKAHLRPLSKTTFKGVSRWDSKWFALPSHHVSAHADLFQIAGLSVGHWNSRCRSVDLVSVGWDEPSFRARSISGVDGGGGTLAY
jgi:hypothetical protein